MNLREVLPHCRVLVDFGCCFTQEEMLKQGVIRIPYVEGDENSANFENVAYNAIMADTVTILDDEKKPINQRIEAARTLAPLADKIVILKKGMGGYYVCAIYNATGAFFDCESHVVRTYRGGGIGQVHVCQ